MSTTVNKKRLKVTELDFDEIKNNLKTYMKSQERFKDYDFEGSGLSALLDVLAYNTHYLAFNANMLANEMFLDSASLRSSISSHAKMLGYETTSARAPIATLNVSLTTSSATKTMPAGTKFSTSIDGTAYSFVSVSDVTAKNVGTTVNFDSLSVYEGSYVTTRYTVDSTDVEQRFLLTDNRADTSTLTVSVINSSSDSTTTTYTKATDITQLSSTSTVYYLQEAEIGKYQVYFGDGVVSKALDDGNIVLLQYVVTNKTAANGANSFTPPSTIDGVSNITVTTVSRAVGGAEPESLNSIKTNAPLDYASQGRAVTSKDFEVYVKKLFGNAQAVSVFGGEDGSFDSSLGVTSTPSYGKVYISIKSTTGANLTSSEKSSLVNSLKSYVVASITPEIIDPQTIFLRLTTTFNYDSNSTTKSNSQLVTNVTDTLRTYNTNSLQSFVGQYRASEVTKKIDETDTSILNNTTSVKLSMFITPTLSTSLSYNLNFSNALLNPESGYLASTGGILSSTGFKITGNDNEMFFDDDGAGNIRMYYFVGTTRTYFNSQAGTITYSSGEIKINTLNIASVSNVDGATSTQIRLIVTPSGNDIVPVRNQLLEIDFTNSTITAQTDTATVSGSATTTTSTGTSTTTTVTTTSGSTSY
tara:strand:- start:452 stop:2377 length:1926 start_codon:yes stop_codon:yes gene_type:complete